MAAWTLTARWVVPVDGPPLERGTVTITGERITAVEARGQRTADRDLGNVAILPGFVNAHTHLDLSGLRNRCPPSLDFTDWLRAVIRHRRSLSHEQIILDIREGLTESQRFGTTLLGDIAGQGLSWPLLSQSLIRAVVFYELLGLTQERAAQSLSSARDWLAAHPATTTCRPGLSPHAPYSVRMNLFAQAARLAQLHKLPLCVHLAETRAELELLHHHQGPFVDFLKELGVWDSTGLADSTKSVMQVCWARPRLMIHANYLHPSARIPRNTTIVYCPRTHAAFGHPPHPFRELLARGIRVALGTDSLASNPDLNVLAEARFLQQRYPDFPGNQLLRLATLSGAEALGWQDETGSMTPGKSADLVVLTLPNEDGSDPHSLILLTPSVVQGVLCCGKWVFRAEGFQPGLA